MMAEYTRLEELAAHTRAEKGLPQPAPPHLPVDNRSAWKIVLGKGVASARSAQMRLLVRVYFAFLDGECAVERDLGDVQAEAAEHSKGVADGDCALLDEKLQIQALPKDAISRETPHGFELTPATRQCMRLWRATVGARFGGYQPREADKPPIKKRPAATGTFASVRRGVLRAAETERRRDGRPSHGDPMTTFGVARSHFARRAADARRAASPFWNKQRAAFRKATVAKNLRARVAQGLLRRGLDAFPTMTSRPAGSVAKPLVGISRVCFLGEVGSASAAASVVEGQGRCQCADLVVVNGLEKLFRPPNPAWVVDLAYVVGLGRPVVASSVWHAAQGVPSAIPAKEVLRVNRAVNKAARIRIAPALKSAQPALWAALSAMAKVAFVSQWVRSRAAVARPWGARGRAGEVGFSAIGGRGGGSGCLSHRGRRPGQVQSWPLKNATSGGRQQVVSG